jgi:hypothetical protein
MNICGG